MQILTVHNKYLFRGGEDESRESEDSLMTQHGHTARQFVLDNKFAPDLSRIRTGLRCCWSHEAYCQVQRILREKPVDVLDVHNFFPLISPSVYYAAKSCGVPVVQTLHNYRLLCPGAICYRNGVPCQDCHGRIVHWPGVLRKCYKNSAKASAAVALMTGLHRLIGTWSKMVGVYVALTEFSRALFIEAGFPAEKIVVKPNFVHPDPGTGDGDGNYAVFVGRLSPEKGIGTLLHAWRNFNPRIPLRIIGDGPLEPLVQAAAAQNPGVEWLGRLPAAETYRHIGHARFLIFPSEWYETFGRVAVEAFAKGTPVIASKVGAIPEIVCHRRTGLHFRPGDSDDLATQVEWALQHPTELAQMRLEARREYEAKYTAERNYRMLMAIYARVVSNSR